MNIAWNIRRELEGRPPPRRYGKTVKNRSLGILWRLHNSRTGIFDYQPTEEEMLREARKYTDAQLLSIPNLGVTCLAWIREHQPK